jgi:hypothetical protein
MRLGEAIRILQTVAAAWVAVVALPLPAAAAGDDLSGVWQGSVRCKAFDGVRRSIPDRGATLTISQLGRFFAAQVEDSQGLRQYNGEVVALTGRDRRVEAVMVECRSSAALNDYLEAVTLRGTLLDERGRLTGESIFRSQLGELGTCKWRLERTSSKLPAIPFCR